MHMQSLELDEYLRSVLQICEQFLLFTKNVNLQA